MSSVTEPAKALRSLKKANSEIPVFDVKLFLDSAGLGRKVAKFRGKETAFSQGDPAKQVMYIQEGGAKLTVVNESGKAAVVAILGPGDFLGGRVPCRPVQLPGDRDHDSTYQRAGY
jgi:CRP-like cAMP-binding protein